MSGLEESAKARILADGFAAFRGDQVITFYDKCHDWVTWPDFSDTIPIGSVIATYLAVSFGAILPIIFFMTFRRAMFHQAIVFFGVWLIFCSFMVNLYCVSWSFTVGWALFGFVFLWMWTYWVSAPITRPGGLLQVLHYNSVGTPSNSSSEDSIVFGGINEFKSITWAQFVLASLFVAWCAVAFAERLHFYTSLMNVGYLYKTNTQLLNYYSRI
jgi:hypothetical protein